MNTCWNNESTENVKAAWNRVKTNKGKPGFDRVTIEGFPEDFRPLWPGIRQSLLSGSYELSPVLRTEIPKRSGGKRPLGIPIVLDRVIQQDIAQVTGPIFDDAFREFKRRVKELTGRSWFGNTGCKSWRNIFVAG